MSKNNNENQKVNCINISYIFKTSIGSINGSWTEGNVSTVKKITTPDGRQLPYISGQSLKYQIKKGWKAMGLGEKLSEVKMAEKSAGVDYTEGDPENYIDDDLFGFMIASTGENRRRTAPIRCSASIGLFRYQGDRDLGTKSKEEQGDMSAGGNIFETEIYYNYFRTNILIELDRVGKFQSFELKDKGKNKKLEINIAEKRERVINFLNSLSNVWGGGKQSRFLTDMSPKFLAITFQNSKVPIFLESLNVNEDETLDTKTINEVLDDYEEIIENKFFGLRSGIFKNEIQKSKLKEGKDEINDSYIENYTTTQDAFNSAIKHIKKLEF